MFRELFVELSEQVLAAAVAQRRVEEKQVVFAAHVDYAHAVRLVAERMLPTGWAMLQAARDSMTDTTHLVVRMDCGHRGIFTFDERELLLKPTEEIVDYIAERFERGPARKCKCVPRSESKFCSVAVGECK